MRKTMNKTTVIIVLAIFLTISVGYALFSDTITIEGTATAQGNFDMEVVSCTPGALPGTDTNHIAVYEEKGYENDTCIVSSDKNKTTFNVDLLYPGAARHFTVKLKNVGTIDAMTRLDSLDATSSANRDSKFCEDGYNGEKNGEIEDSECRAPGIGYPEIEGYFQGVAAIEDDKGNIVYMTDDNTATEISKYAVIKDGVVYVKIPPNYSIYMPYFMKFRENVTENNLMKLSYTYTYDFVQATE